MATQRTPKATTVTVEDIANTGVRFPGKGRRATRNVQDDMIDEAWKRHQRWQEQGLPNDQNMFMLDLSHMSDAEVAKFSQQLKNAAGRQGLVCKWRTIVERPGPYAEHEFKLSEGSRKLETVTNCFQLEASKA